MKQLKTNKMNTTNNTQILFDVKNSIIDGIIVDQTEKAVKIDFGMNPIGAYGVISVYNKTMWIPKSVLVDNTGYFTIKQWFANKFVDQKKYSIKPYYVKNTEKVYC
jgi:hypothetical protein